MKFNARDVKAEGAATFPSPSLPSRLHTDVTPGVMNNGGGSREGTCFVVCLFVFNSIHLLAVNSGCIYRKLTRSGMIPIYKEVLRSITVADARRAAHAIRHHLSPGSGSGTCRLMVCDTGKRGSRTNKGECNEMHL